MEGRCIDIEIVSIPQSAVCASIEESTSRERHMEGRYIPVSDRDDATQGGSEEIVSISPTADCASDRERTGVASASASTGDKAANDELREGDIQESEEVTDCRLGEDTQNQFGDAHAGIKSQIKTDTALVLETAKARQGDRPRAPNVQRATETGDRSASTSSWSINNQALASVLGINLPAPLPSQRYATASSKPGAYAIRGLPTGHRPRQAVQEEEKSNSSDSAELVEAQPVATLHVTTEQSPLEKLFINFTSSRRLAFLLAVVALGAIGLAWYMSIRALVSDPVTRQRQHIRAVLEREFGEDYFHVAVNQKALDWIMYEDPLQSLQVKEEEDSTTATSHLIQRFILVLFYFQTSSQPWKYCSPPTGQQSDVCFFVWNDAQTRNEVRSTRWLSGTHECQWRGVYCDIRTRTVTGLDLGFNNLTGRIPSELSRLSELKGLTLPGNKLSGSVPQWLDKLPTFEEINLRNNTLTGTIPPSLFLLPGLKSLSFNNNHLTGSIPTEVGHFGGKKLWLSGNSMTGSIPDNIFACTQLELVWLGSPGLSGTLSTKIGQMSNLYDWDVSGCEALEGTIPTEIGLLSELSFLSLENTIIHGSIPDEIYQLPRLSILCLSDSRLSGTISPMIGLLTDLDHFRIANTNISGTLPEEISLVTNLLELDVRGNMNLAGSIPKKICDTRLNLKTKISADCTPLKRSGIPQMICQEGCCSTCCDASTSICIQQ